MADILILGTNGYSGRITAKYLLEHPQRNTFRLALAARSRSKIEAAKLPLDSSVQLWEVDITDEAALEETIGKVSVVINCVGPYWRTGTPIVRACVRQGKHYVDITGETHWIYDIIQLYDFHATRTRSIIVPSCGFDSAPSDAVVYAANRALKARYPDAEIDGSVTAIDADSGGLGAGTLQTVLSMFSEVPRSVIELSSQSYALSPVHGGKPYPKFNFLYALPYPLNNVIGAYSIMAPMNSAIVQRTFGLLELNKSKAPQLAYGPRFRYEEFNVSRGIIRACLTSALVAVGLFSLAFFAPVRWLFGRVIPSSGNGPTEAKLKAGHLNMTNVTTAHTSPGGSRVRVKSELKSNSPLIITSVVAAEAALLLLNPSKLPELAQKGGILTPMTAFGDVLLERLEKTGQWNLSAEILGDGDAENPKTK
ncbi:NAD-P-binding protein [Peniophora sp. CONT]|nr:NAD-P-binding protein [Peniophora sp. CONT]